MSAKWIPVFLLLLLLLGSCRDSDDKITVVTVHYYNRQADLEDPTGVLTINQVVVVGIPDSYRDQTGPPISCGSAQPAGPSFTMVQVGTPWFDLSDIPLDSTVVSATLILETDTAPATAIEIEVRDLSTDPNSITTSDPIECEAMHNDGTSGNLYATFQVDDSLLFIEVPLDIQGVEDLQTAVSGGLGFGVGLRAPTADETNIVEVYFHATAVLEIEYRKP